ncbi:hypothetical protein SCHPADRAFT_734303 [Schizopora paradoxa]|uniref:Uncharacterized protein n=1 Tax=Schizopora paradoxa TaxID=27342 RepID=A0A0H2R084_9AGAM|nr:hypothetical protein SCHPADRAFT_734303 [Schizopora paradoxa]
MTANDPALCAVCQRKPKWKNFEFCGKTCAGRAQTLCSYCRKHPRASGHEFCSRNCASLATNRERPVKSLPNPPQTVAVNPSQLLQNTIPPSPAPMKRKKSFTAKLFEAAKSTIRRHSEGDDTSHTTSPELAQLQALLQSQLQPYVQVVGTPTMAQASLASQRSCIMCRMRPARGESHFCSKPCRIQALGRAT